MENILNKWEEAVLGRRTLAEYQQDSFQKTMVHCMTNDFYREKLAKNAGKVLSQIDTFPFIDGTSLAKENFLCVPQTEVERVHSTYTSGTQGKRKRIYSTKEDIENTVLFFSYGLQMIADENENVLILMNRSMPDGVTDLICKGLETFHAKGITVSDPQDITKCIQEAENKQIHAVIGPPVAVSAFLHVFKTQSIKKVLLSAEYVPTGIVDRIRNLGIEVFQHYGLTEVGYAGAIDCPYHKGMHIREEDLYVEIIDPKTGKVVPDGEEGEIVITTLNREAMPLIRYRTGDISRIINQPCLCKSSLRRLGSVKRIGEHGDKQAQMDEQMFSIPEVADYLVSEEKEQLRIMYYPDMGKPEKLSLINLCGTLQTLYEPFIGTLSYYQSKRWVKM